MKTLKMKVSGIPRTIMGVDRRLHAYYHPKVQRWGWGRGTHNHPPKAPQQKVRQPSQQLHHHLCQKLEAIVMVLPTPAHNKRLQCRLQHMMRTRRKQRVLENKRDFLPPTYQSNIGREETYTQKKGIYRPPTCQLLDHPQHHQ